MNDRLTPEREAAIRSRVSMAEHDKEHYGIEYDNADLLSDLLAELDACRRDLAEERARTTRLTEALAPFLRYPQYLSIGSIDNTVEVRVSRERFEAARAALAECGAGTEQPA